MNHFHIAARRWVVLLSLLMIAGIEVAAGQAKPSKPAIGAVGVKVQTQSLAYRVDLRPEIEPSMFQGTIEAVDPSESSITIRTDLGRMLILFSLDCRTMTRLRQGDRVFLEPDTQGTLTVKTVNRAAQDGSQSLELGGQVAWLSGHCSESSL